MGVAQGVFAFKVQLDDGVRDCITGRAGLPILAELMRAAVPRSFHEALARSLGYRSWKVVRRHVESLALLIAAGGECVDDLRMLRADVGLCALIGYRPSGTSQAKEFLYRFHQSAQGARLAPQDDDALSIVGKAQIRPEGPGLRALGAVCSRVLGVLQARRPHTRATLDVDATIIEAMKKRALKAYEGTVGYQPQMAWWAEQGAWVVDQFRDGNVPAEFEAREFLQFAFGGLPSGITERRLRGDSALYNEKALTWADEEDIEFAVSADMSPDLDKRVRALSEASWKPYRAIKPHEAQANAREERQWAEVEFIPEWGRNHKKDGTPFRYLAIRVRSKQRELFVAEDNTWRHFAVVTNMDWTDGERLLRWHREKQGTVEHGHGDVKNELAGGTLPCGRFGSNAAWWRLNVLTHNLFALLKATALPAELSTARPKALRFRLFNVAGRVLRHGRQTVLRVCSLVPTAALYIRARRAVLDLAAACRAAPSPAPA